MKLPIIPFFVRRSARPVSTVFRVTDRMRTSVQLVFICFAFLSGWAQNPGSEGCLARAQLEPALVSNPKTEVTFACEDATALELIESIGRQTRIPIGIVLGEDDARLSKTRRNYQLFRVDAKSALTEAVVGTGYSVSESDAGFLLTAGDLTSRQREVLRQELVDFRAGPDTPMVQLGTQLSMWLQAAIDPSRGFAASIGGSTNDERFTLQTLPPLTVQQIADGIVSLGSKGMWILTTDPFQRTSEWTDQIQIEPYQHYSNQPVLDH